MSSTRLRAVGAAAMAVILGHVAVAEATLNACLAGKERCVAKLAAGWLRCHDKAEKEGRDPFLDAVVQSCLNKARTRFDVAAKGCFPRLEQKGGCLTTADSNEVAEVVGEFVGDVVTDLDPAYPAPVQNLCAAAKKTCAGRYAAARLACHAKADKPPKGLPAGGFEACTAKARAKFDGGTAPARGCFAKLEAKYAGACLTTNDTAAVAGKVEAFVDAMACTLDPPDATCPSPTPTPAPSFACCSLFGMFCGNMPPGQPGDCTIQGGTIVVGAVCQPDEDQSGCPVPGACGDCVPPPTPTPTPTP